MRQPADEIATETLPPPAGGARLLVLGIRCQFTDAVVDRLLQRGANVVGVALSGPRDLVTPLRTAASKSALPMAGASQTRPGAVQRYVIGSLTATNTTEFVASLQPDLMLVACFPRRIPSSFRSLAPGGAWNIHPSALPENRGPDPLFWAFKRGDGRFGVTVHVMTEKYDAGPIVAAALRHDLHGVSEDALERQLATLGADLAVDALSGGPVRDVRLTPQNERRATYEGWPTLDDYVIDVSRPASAVVNFVHGIRGRGVPIRLTTTDGTFEVLDARVADVDATDSLPGDTVVVECNPGRLVVRVRPWIGGTS